MTKVDIITKIIETKNNELEVAYEAIKTRNETVVNPGYKAIVDKYFNDFSNEEIYTKVSSDGELVTFLRPHVDYNYPKDLMDLRLRTDWKTGEVTDVHTSVYSTSDNSVWELERLQLVGQIASILIDYKDDFMAEMMSFKEACKKESKAVRQVGYDIEKDIRECNKEIDRMHTEAAEELLNGKGLEFGTKLASVDISWNNEVRRVSKARIVGKTPSGKSADLEITTSYQGNQENVHIFKKVRMTNVSTLVSQYKSYVINA
jgi:hypothetical protein